MVIKIDKGIPAPAENSHAGKYPFSLMEIGDSFFICLDAVRVDGFRSTASIAGKRHQMRYRIRKEENGARVWRIE
jgi:hypothetical protein